MDEFVLSVARYLEANDSTLIRAKKRLLYPKLEKQEPPPSNQGSTSDYASYVDFHPTAPPSTQATSQSVPSLSPVNPASIHPPQSPAPFEREQRMPRTRSQTSIAAQGPTHVTHVTHHYHSREESLFYRQPQPTVIVQSPPATNVYVQQPGSSSLERRRNTKSAKEKTEEKEETQENNTGSAMMGVALLASSTAATT